MSPAPRIDVVLFDLGGVLVDPGGVGPMRMLSGISSDEELWVRWLSCRWVRRFEAGRCTPDAFAAGVVADWGLDLEPATFLAQFGSWPGRPYDGAVQLVTEVRRRLPVACLSNMNAVQWEARYRSTPLADTFDMRLLSYELGMVKPDREIFEEVAARLPATRESVLFLDDNVVNVESAAAAGFEARHVRGVAGARAALGEAGVLGARR